MKNNAKRLFSKSRYLLGLQCPRYLWISLNQPELIPAPDMVTRYLFNQGNKVGELAKKLFHDGINVATDDFSNNIRMTRELLPERRPLFEAGIAAGRFYCRPDVLNPAKGNRWDIIEVKSSTTVKDVNIHDVAFQKFCCEKSGIEVGRCFLAHVNNQYVKMGEINPREFLAITDITSKVIEAGWGIEDRADTMLEIISGEVCPIVDIGKHCKDPYECPLIDCWEGIPEHSVFTLYRGGKKAYELYGNGIIKIVDIPKTYLLNSKQQIQQRCIASGKPHVNSEGIREFLLSLQYPLYYLDFETIGPAVPMFDGTRPYQAVPFQFSLHIVKEAGGSPDHLSFLASGTGDPRPAFLAELKKALGESGSIIVYNQSFEEGILKELAIVFPKYTDWVSGVRGRLVDLLLPFSRFCYYHLAQKGSASLKAVLPAVTGRGYEGMDITDGQTASNTFEKITYGEVPEEERNKVRADLEKYCALDTKGMIWIVDELQKLCKS